jgi:serine/threonine-protein kinase
VDKALETARKVCAGLAAAHERGVLHRDLKPANIMIDRRGQVIIMDFGLAGLSDQMHGDVRSGTPAYMAPEQLAGTEVTIRSDIYALGLVLYELFAGKRAFEAATMVELMQMQQRATPVSLTSIVKELDPAVEGVILRCLAADPKQRPASALSIAAALPGGDPLAAALAAGETPSPELVAAAGETEGLRPKVAVTWLAAAVAGLLAVAILAPFVQISEAIHLENSPEALARDARTLLQTLGYTARPVDRAWGFSYDNDYRNYLGRHPAEAAARWKNPSAGEPPLITFWYRESPSPAPAERNLNVQVSYIDPALERPGMIRLRLDPGGKLTQLETVPAQVEAPAPAGSFDWNKLFQAAGLDITRFHPVEPQWTPLANWDQRAAWVADPLRIEAAAWRGRPVWFRIIGPWTVPGRGGLPANAGQITQVAIVYTALAAACILAWLNFRARKTDLRGATKLAAWCWLGYAGGSFLLAHHVGSIAEINTFWRVVFGSGAINGGVVWVLYLALEPWVRRRWPQTMISWSRYAVKGWRDPLVGRDLLYSVTIGALLGVLNLIGAAARAYSKTPDFPDLSALPGIASMTGNIFAAFGNAVVDTLLLFFLLFILRLLLRIEWAAVVGVVALITILTTAQNGFQRPDLAFVIGIAGSAILTIAILRFGLIAAMFSFAISNSLQLPHTLDFSAWYAGLTAVPLILMGLLAFYGFRTALAGRRLIQLPD